MEYRPHQKVVGDESRSKDSAADPEILLKRVKRTIGGGGLGLRLVCTTNAARERKHYQGREAGFSKGLAIHLNYSFKSDDPDTIGFTNGYEANRVPASP